MQVQLLLVDYPNRFWNTGRLVFGVSDGTGSDDRMVLKQVGGLSLYPNEV